MPINFIIFRFLVAPVEWFVRVCAFLCCVDLEITEEYFDGDEPVE